jgi:predicted transcriptional regulator
MKQDIFILPNSSLYFALQKLQATGLKCLIVIDKKKKLLGTISDGDIRRAIINRTKVSSKINKIYNKNCLFIYESLIDMQSIQKKMDLDSIDIVPVVNKKKLIIDYIKKNEFKNFVPSNNKKNLDKKIDINLEVVIMAGGEGTRLRPFTSILPKALIPIKE